MNHTMSTANTTKIPSPLSSSSSSSSSTPRNTAATHGGLDTVQARKRLRDSGEEKETATQDGNNNGNNNNSQDGEEDVVSSSHAQKRKLSTTLDNERDAEEVEVVSTSSSSSTFSTCEICPETKDGAATTTNSTALTVGTAKDGASMEILNLSDAEKMTKMTDACKTILSCIGEDPNREGLLCTPERWAKALLFMTHGYKKDLRTVLNGAVFSENHKEMVLVRDIDLHSLCEHHMLPFTGRIHVGYIPNGKILGLSKIARIADVYARRLQVQERLNSQIADAIVEAVHPLGVAVVIECSHFCMVMRGVQKVGATTITSCVRGCFEKCAKTRAEFFSIIHNSNNRGRF